MIKHLFSEMDITEENILKWAGRNEPKESMLGELRNVIGRWHYQWLEQMSLNDLRQMAHEYALNGDGSDDNNMPIMKKSMKECLIIIMDEIIPIVQDTDTILSMGRLIEEPPFCFGSATDD